MNADTRSDQKQDSRYDWLGNENHRQDQGQPQKHQRRDLGPAADSMVLDVLGQVGAEQRVIHQPVMQRF